VTQYIKIKKRVKKRNKWIKKNEAAKGPSFLNQKTVLVL
jgi:hypothetical protein